jgi:flagellar biosynthetic protein FliR
MELFDHLLSAAQIWLATFIGVFLRVGACFFVLPGLGEQMIPVRIRLGAALAMAVLLTPMLRDEVRISGLMPSGRFFSAKP